MKLYCKRCFNELPLDEPNYPSVIEDQERQTPLSYATDMSRRCPNCRKWFSFGRPRTYLLNPFPSRQRVILNTILVTILGILVSMVVAVFQMPMMRAGGH